MQQTTILIAGCGDVGSTLGSLLVADGHQVFGLRRNINQLPQGIQGISADLGQSLQLKQKLSVLQPVDILVYSAAASEPGEAGYRKAYVEGVANVLSALPQKPKHIFFTSSTGVYHQDDHDWVDEDSPCQPSRYNGQIMLEAERQLIQGEIGASIVRFSGIYGPGRNHLLSKVKSGEIAPAEPVQYSNRIHRDDCAGVLKHLIDRFMQGETLDNIYLASDDQPTPLHDVTLWIAEQMSVAVKDATIGRFGGSKRCSNRKLKQSGYEFIYPSFKEGYKDLINQGTD